MSYVVINLTEAPKERTGDLEERFAGRPGEVGKSEGFQAFEVLRPDNEAACDRYLVYTRWASKSAFEGWMAGSAFARGHAGASGQGPVARGNHVWAYQVAQHEES
jgi:heme oxygenase (mycobilin-producing)